MIRVLDLDTEIAGHSVIAGRLNRLLGKLLLFGIDTKTAFDGVGRCLKYSWSHCEVLELIDGRRIEGREKRGRTVYLRQQSSHLASSRTQCRGSNSPQYREVGE